MLYKVGKEFRKKEMDWKEYIGGKLYEENYQKSKKKRCFSILSR